jgi:hypothetical protein
MIQALSFEFNRECSTFSLEYRMYGEVKIFKITVSHLILKLVEQLVEACP